MFVAALRDWEKQLEFETVVNRFVVHEVLKFHETQVRDSHLPPLTMQAMWSLNCQACPSTLICAIVIQVEELLDLFHRQEVAQAEYKKETKELMKAKGKQEDMDLALLQEKMDNAAKNFECCNKAFMFSGKLFY